MRVKNNPLKPTETETLSRLLRKGKFESDNAEVQEIDRALRSQPVTQQELNTDVVKSMFPRRGIPGVKSKSWNDDIISQSLSKHDLISRISSIVAEPPSVGGRSLTDAELANYIASEAQISLEEARTMLARMRGSLTQRVDSKGQKFARAMQPSSAMTRTSQVRKLSNYHLPLNSQLTESNHDIVIAVSPENTTARVMTWRKGTHIDADLATKDNGNLLPLLSLAIKSAIMWLAEKPGRTKGKVITKTQVLPAKLLLYRIGDMKASVLWQTGEPLSIETIRQNWDRVIPVHTGEVARLDLEHYYEAMTAMFGTVNLHRRRSKKERATEMQTLVFEEGGLQGPSSSYTQPPRVPSFELGGTTRESESELGGSEEEDDEPKDIWGRPLR